MSQLDATPSITALSFLCITMLSFLRIMLFAHDIVQHKPSPFLRFRVCELQGKLRALRHDHKQSTAHRLACTISKSAVFLQPSQLQLFVKCRLDPPLHPVADRRPLANVEWNLDPPVKLAWIESSEAAMRANVERMVFVLGEDCCRSEGGTIYGLGMHLEDGGHQWLALSRRIGLFLQKFGPRRLLRPWHRL